MTANAPPPPDSQLTDRNSGFTWQTRLLCVAFMIRTLEVGLYLHKIGIPRIPTDVEIVVAELLPGRLSEDVSCMEGSGQSSASTGGNASRIANKGQLTASLFWWWLGGEARNARSRAWMPGWRKRGRSRLLTIFRRAHESARHW